ncbi:MAG: 3-methyl-2-oxobutanoate hydroxymethyltransferase [Dehalococcoidia bacterium]|jgi:3-methyl-2-oxobutanoate hydroxymethyltransferase|nr:3-methyl-2-oxobutanoate hydroxymethyltransferase [Dehalococcoidia bacterium]
MRVTLQEILGFKKRGERFPMLTAYDYPTAKVVDEAGVPLILVGDSLGNVVLGYDSTVFVTMDVMIHHTAAVVRGARRALVVGDMPFMSYQTGTVTALENAARFLREAGAQAVKLEGGEIMAETIKALVDRGIPVMGHIGFTPQSAYQIGQRVQGRSIDAAEKLVRDAHAVEDAGAFAVVLELVPSELAKLITERLTIPTIGIGAGPDCDSQVQVVSDMLGLYTDFVPRHAKQFAHLADDMRSAVTTYSESVREGSFPTEENGSSLKDEVLTELEARLRKGAG